MPVAEKKKRILIVCQHFWPETFRINDIADFFANEKNCDVEVLCGVPNYPSGQLASGYSVFKNRRQSHNNVIIRRAFEIPRGNNSSIRIFLNYISFPIASLFHIPRLLTKKYDKIFIYQLSPVMMSIAGIIVGKIKKIETTMYVLDMWPENLYSVLDIRNPVMRRVAESVSHWHYRHVDKLVVLSEKMRQSLLEATNISEKKIIILPQAAEKIYETPIHDNDLQKRFKDGFNLVFTGSITPAQSFGTIIKTAKILRERKIGRINWIIVGEGMSRKQVETDVKAAGLDDIFFFEGQKPVSDIPRYTAIADGLIGCLAKSDMLDATIPAKVMSYIASGTPLVLAMDGEVQKLINNTIKNGYAGPADDSKKLAENIIKLFSLTQKQRNEMGNRARMYHHKKFERSIILNQLYRFIFDKG